MNYDHTAETGIQVRRRFRIIRKFIGRHDFAGMSVGNWGWDFVAKEFHIEPPLNEWHYDFIVCFDVIEHRFNPGLLLDDIYEHLNDGGTLYLTTPVGTFFKNKGHVAEYTTQVMRDMLEFYGFTIVRSEVHRVWDWKFMFYGIRPFFKTLIQHFQMYECRKV